MNISKLIRTLFFISLIYTTHLYSFEICFIDIPKLSKIKTGYINLKWDINLAKSTNMTIMYELQRSRTPDFKKPLIIYNGYDKATFISGMPEGNFYFRVRALKDKQTAVTEWSDTIEVEVEYQSAFLTITLLFAGAGIFLAIVLVVIIGNFKTKEDLG